MHVFTVIRVLRGLEGGVFTIIRVLRGLEGGVFPIICVLQGLDGGSAGDAAVPTCLDASNRAHVNNTIMNKKGGFTTGKRWFSKRERVYPPIESLRLWKLSI